MKRFCSYDILLKQLMSFSNKALEKMKKNLVLEYELYDFVKERLQHQYEECEEKRKKINNDFSNKHN